MKPRIIFLLNSVGLNRGGLTHASLRQASTFADAGYDTQVLTFNYEPSFPVIIEKLVQRGKVSRKVIMRNMFHERAGYGRRDKIKRGRMKVDISDYTGEYAISRRKNHNAYRLLKNGMYEKYISLREDDTLDFIDYFNENRYRTRREHYDYYGNITRINYFSFEENKLRQQVFYDKKGKAFLSTWFEPSKDKTTRVIHFGKDNTVISETTGDEAIHKRHWLNAVIDEHSSRAVVISDTRSTDSVLVGLDNDKAKRVLRPHSNHLSDADNPDSELNPRNRYAIRKIPEVDAIAVLTEKQKQDIVSRFGHEEKIFVIPNYYECGPPKITGLRSLAVNVKQRAGTTKERDMFKVVVISRFSGVKNIDHTIKAFKDVVKAVPEAKLEIWGQGDKKEEYLNLIKELGVGDNVKVKGYTQHPENVYRSAALSLVTSKAEGFSLSVMESMVNHTPVVSYDIRYGPSDMIEDGKNGFLIEKGDINALAKRIIHVLQNPAAARKMGETAGRTMDEKFGLDSYQKKWFSFVDHLLKKDKKGGRKD